MQKNKRTPISAVLALVIACQCAALDAATFTYHGTLQDAGKAAEGNYDLELTLYSAPDGGSVIAGPVTMYKVPVHDSAFSAEADFGPLANSTQQAWLGVKVRNAGSGEFAALSARSPVSPDATTSVCPGAWTLSGNAGNVAGINFLGNVDNVPLDLRSNNLRALRIETQSNASAYGDTANVTGGSPANATGAAIGATVAGGGSTREAGNLCPACANSATANFSAVSGGLKNSATGDLSSVAGGLLNAAQGSTSFVGGGVANRAGGSASAIGGGDGNRAGALATVPGGDTNCAGGDSSFAAGSNANVRQPMGSTLCGAIATSGDDSGDEGTFVWADRQGSNFVSTGPNQFLIRAAGNVGINTNQPRAPLHVQYGTTSLGVAAHPAAVLMVEKASGNSFLSIMGANGAQRGLIFGEPGSIDDGGVFYDGDAGSNAMGFRTNGNVQRMVLSSVGDLTITGTNATKATAGSWLGSSDARIKRDIRPVEHAVDTLLRVRPVTFQYNADYRAAHPGVGDQRYYNVVAQEFAEVFPDAVQSSHETLPGAKATRENEILQVDIHPALITTIAAVQEVAVADQMRDERIAALARENAELRARLERIERMLAERHDSSN